VKAQRVIITDPPWLNGLGCLLLLGWLLWRGLRIAAWLCWLVMWLTISAVILVMAQGGYYERRGLQPRYPPVRGGII
jgi:hypothetical protein